MPMPGSEASRDRYRGCLLGLACGDAVGTAVEFRPRGSFAPVTDMVGGGPFDLKPGEWTDDTSMALCLGTSLLECGGFDARDQMERYCRWWREGYLSSNGRCFDIGGTVADALRRYQDGGDPYSGSTSPRSAGNGSIMRLAPVPMLFTPAEDAVVHYAGESSRTTHGCDEAVDACRLLGLIVARALAGADREELLTAGESLEGPGGRPVAASIAAIASGSWRDRPESEIEGSGYVVPSLEAALWSFATTTSYRDAILRAVNFGDDADTTAAVCGQIAGAFYGERGIPEEWLAKLVMREAIAERAEKLREARG
jgi:ADP-ribosyl-[dinitrogen reductase] hydrolase